MRPVRRARLALIVCLFVLAAQVGFADETTVSGADKDLTRSVRLIADRWVQVRAESFDRPPLAVRSPAVLAEVAATARAYRAVSPQRLEARGRAWNDLGLGGPGSPLLLWLALAQDLAGIDLDADGARLLVAPDRLTEADYGVQAHEREFVPDGAGGMREYTADDAPPSVDDALPTDRSGSEFLLATGVRPDEPLLVHYLTHLRQLERHDEDSLRDTTDGLLAASAWAEGEANLVSLYFLFSGIGVAGTVLTGSVGPGDFLDGQLIPAALSQETPVEARLLTFVYEDGYDFANLHWQRSGWNVFSGPTPETTRQLLHAEGPAKPIVWSEPVAPAAGYTLVDTDRLGEQAIATLFSIWTANDGAASRAALGWSGDRLLRWERSAADAYTVWESAWSSAPDALEFVDEFLDAMRRRYPKLEVASGADGTQSFRTRYRRFTVTRAAERVRIEVAAGAAGSFE